LLEEELHFHPGVFFSTVFLSAVFPHFFVFLHLLVFLLSGILLCLLYWCGSKCIYTTKRDGGNRDHTDSLFHNKLI
jgi:hypothetical protein